MANKLVLEEARLDREGIKVTHYVQEAEPKVGKRHQKSHQRAPPKMKDFDQANPKKRQRKIIDATFVKRLDTFKKIALKEEKGSNRKVILWVA